MKTTSISETAGLCAGLAIALLLCSLLLLPCLSNTPEAQQPVVPTQQPVAKELATAGFVSQWMKALPPRCVIVARKRGETKAIKSIQAPLAAKGWCTVTLDVQSAPEIAAHLKVTGESVVCVCDGEVLDVLPASASTKEIAKLFAEHLAAGTPQPNVSMRSVEAFNGMIYYTADWCLACRKYKSLIDELREHHPVRIVNVGERPLTSFNIDVLPTFDFVRDGEVKQRLIGGAKEEEIRAALRRVLDVLTDIPAPRQHWNVNGVDHPSREALIRHLLEGSAHRGKFTLSELSLLSTAELERLHSADHEGLLVKR
jgi:thiol-disulfide isomerase/thioredoxin